MKCIQFEICPTGGRDGVEFFRFPFAEADAFKDQTLNEEDVSNVVCEILEVQAKSYTFGRVLRLPKVTVDSIHPALSFSAFLLQRLTRSKIRR